MPKSGPLWGPLKSKQRKPTTAGGQRWVIANDRQSLQNQRVSHACVSAIISYEIDGLII